MGNDIVRFQSGNEPKESRTGRKIKNPVCSDFVAFKSDLSNNRKVRMKNERVRRERRSFNSTEAPKDAIK